MPFFFSGDDYLWTYHLSFRIIPFAENPLTYSFNISGLNEIIEKHSEYFKDFLDWKSELLHRKALLEDPNYQKSLRELTNIYDEFKNKTYDEIREEFLVISPDAGATKRTLKFAKILKLNTLIMHKQRNYSKVNYVEKTIIIGDINSLQNKTAIILDDMCDTGGTLIKACDTLVEYGANKVIAIVTHGILSGPALERINQSKHLEKIIVSNTIPQDYNKAHCSKLEVFPVDELLADAINKLTTFISSKN